MRRQRPRVSALLAGIIGALVIGVLTNGLVLLGVQEFWKKVITGLVIILAVVLDQLQERLQQRLALKRT